MSGRKSVLASMTITAAGNSHNCRANEAHRIPKGTKRLTIKEERAQLHYCLPCARIMLGRGLTALQTLYEAVDAELAKPSNDVERAS